MTDQSELPFDHDDEIDTAFDSTFATTTRIQLDETSWVDHVAGWLTGNQALMATLMVDAQWEQPSRWISGQYGQRYTRLWMNWYRDHQDCTG